MPRSRSKSVFSFTSSSSTASSRSPNGDDSSCSSSSSSSSSDMDDDEPVDYHISKKARRHKSKSKQSQAITDTAAAKSSTDAASARPNILLRVLQRERTGYLSSGLLLRSNQQRLAAVPGGLSFCLQDIVPYCYLTGHVFMGLTVCGQFLLSYQVTVIETNDFSQFSIGSYKYEIFFWIYRPHQLLRKYYSRCLFDDRGADNEVTVTMCQWLGTPGTIVVHGSCKYDSEDSYVSVLAVPRLGCLACRRLRDRLHGRYSADAAAATASASSRSAVLCIRCHLSVHTKYTRAESDPPFEPRINLNCPERLILYANGLIHMLNVRLEMLQPAKSKRQTACLDERYVRRKESDNCATIRPVASAIPAPVMHCEPTPPLPEAALKPADIVAQIIADFDDYETSSTASSVSISTAAGSTAAVTATATPRPLMTTKYFEEMLINTLPTTGLPTAGRTGRPGPVANNSRRWITRLAASSSPPKSPAVAASETTTPAATAASTASAYEFSDEPPERYEKISSFRKRRLADKKYEFSEDNSENIIPFAKLRMRRQNILMGGAAGSGGGGGTGGGITLATSPHNSLSSGGGGGGGGGNGGGGSPSTTAETAAQPHSHRASPSHGFRSPCGSPVGGNRFSIMSPPMSVVTASMYGRSPTYKPFGSSPRYAKRFGDGNGGELAVPARTIYSPMLLSPTRSALGGEGGAVGAVDFELFRLGNSSAALPLAEVKPSNIFNCAAVTATATPAVDQALPAKDGTVATPATAATANVEEASASDGGQQPLCAKQLLRRYVEQLRPFVGDSDNGADGDDDEDDRTSVMTADEDDDCISPGFHTSLPVEVHGSCYATMRPVSANGLLQHRQRQLEQEQQTSAAVVITQHTFDLETLTYHIANHLCTLHGKQYGSFYDWACEPIHICPLSAVLVSLLLVNFTARDATQPGAEPCLNCANGDRLDCAFHRRHFEARSLFTWDVCTGDWCVVDYGTLTELPVNVLQQRQQRSGSGCGRGGSSSSIGGGSGAGGGGGGSSGVDDAATDSSDGSPRTVVGTSAASAANAPAEDLAACARRLAVEMQQATAPPLIGNGRRKMAAKSEGNGRAANRHVDVSWSMAGLHTLDSCTERSKEFLRDQFNAIEFVRGAAGAGGELQTNAVPLYRMASMSSSSSSDNSDWE